MELCRYEQYRIAGGGKRRVRQLRSAFVDWLRHGSRWHVDHEWRNGDGERHVRFGLERWNWSRKYQWGNFESEPIERHRFHQRHLGVERGGNGEGRDHWRSLHLGRQLYRRWKNHGQRRSKRVLFL